MHSFQVQSSSCTSDEVVLSNYCTSIAIRVGKKFNLYSSSPFRIGRTGRFGRSGLAINFVDGTRSKKNLDAIKQHFGVQILKLDTNDFDSLEKAISS